MDEELTYLMLWGGLGFGIAFGVLLQRSGFCMLAAVTNFSLMRDYRQLHAWLAALAIAIPGTALLELSNLADIGASSFRSNYLQWFGPIVGGLVFGIGTVLAGGCASRTLIRTAEGNIGALITLVSFTMATIVTLFGALGPLRVWLQQQSAIETTFIDNSLSTLTGMSPIWVAILITAGLLFIILTTDRSNKDWRLIAMGAGLGSLIVGAWWFTGYLAQDEFDPRPPFTISVSGPLARTGLWLMTMSLSATWFGIGLIAGMLFGSMGSAIQNRTFHWNLPEISRLPYLIIGGVMMGIGAVFAGGCNIGQGLGGISTCSITSLLAVMAIFAGMRLGLGWITHSESTTPA